MKKLITLALFAFIAFYSSTAQVNKGEAMLGGSIGVNTAKQEYNSAGSSTTEEKVTAFTFSPQLGFGLGQGWVVGVNLGYSLGKTENKGVFQDNETKVELFSPGIFVRKFRSFGNKFGIFGQADAYYGFGKQIFKESSATTAEYDIKEYGVSLQPGGFYRVSNKFIIEAAIGNIGYRRRVSDRENSNLEIKSSELDISLTNNLSLGFKVIL